MSGQVRSPRRSATRPVGAMRGSGALGGERQVALVGTEPLVPPEVPQAQMHPQAMQVGRQNGQLDDALEAVPAAVPHPVQPVMLQMVDRRLHAGVQTAHRAELRMVRPPPLLRVQVSLLRQRVHLQQRVQPLPVGRTVEAVAALPLDVRAQHEAPVILQDRHRLSMSRLNVPLLST